MLTVHKKIVLDEKGNPTEVIIPWKVYKEMEELLGLDLDKNAIEDLKQAKEDREKRVSCKEGIKRDSRRDVKTLFKNTTRENVAKKT